MLVEVHRRQYNIEVIYFKSEVGIKVNKSIFLHVRSLFFMKLPPDKREIFCHQVGSP